jgi:hypothetical protein
MKRDYKKELKELYKPSPLKASFIDVPDMNFLMIDGRGDPNTSVAYAQAIEALYAVSYALKFMIKSGSLDIDYGVMPLEGLWWADDISAFKKDKKDEWLWTMMIMQPDFIRKDNVDVAIGQVRKKKNPVALNKIRFEKFSEGASAQIMHIGPFTEEGPTIEKLHSFILENGARNRDKHHEIYLSDIRRAEARRWKTIIRQPVTMKNKQ